MSSKTTRKLPQLSDFPVEQVTPAVLVLLEICHEQAEEIHALRDEIARLKGQKPRPRMRPSKLEGDNNKNPGGGRGNQRKGSKTKRLKIHKTVVIRPDGIPEGSRFKGYQDYTVQDIRIWPSSATTPASSMCCCTLCAGSMPNGCFPSSSVSMTRSVKP